VSLLAGAGLASLLAVGALGLGGLALWGDGQKDERGYVSTGNADGSRGVQADISAGAKLPFLNELGWSAIGSGHAPAAHRGRAAGAGRPRPAPPIAR
jgi:hypothetical protein